MIETVSAPAVPEDFVGLVLDHCKVEQGDEETAYTGLIEEYLAAAIERVEAMSGRRLFERTLRLTVDTFGTALEIPASPVSAIISVAYVDTDGQQQTLAGGAYALIDKAETPRLFPVYGAEWPRVRNFPGSVVVEFKAGYGAGTEDVPAALRMAVLQTVADWFRFGGNVVTAGFGELPESAYRACLSFRRAWA
jgi:uncharacterized phiE125 gp8 family phage protein